MEFNDYYQLVKRYNPNANQGKLFRDLADRAYARELQADQLSVAETIYQLYRDRERGQTYQRSQTVDDDTPSIWVQWVLVFAVITFIIQIAKYLYAQY